MTVTISREQSRALDHRAVEEFGMTGAMLMENAGRGAANVLCDLGVRGTVVIVCGRGNNGGDGFVIARISTCAVMPYACCCATIPPNIAATRR